MRRAKKIIREFPQCNSWCEGQRCWRNKGHYPHDHHTAPGKTWSRGAEDGGSKSYLKDWAGWNQPRVPLKQLIKSLDNAIAVLRKRRRDLLKGIR